MASTSSTLRTGLNASISESTPTIGKPTKRCSDPQAPCSHALLTAGAEQRVLVPAGPGSDPNRPRMHREGRGRLHWSARAGGVGAGPWHGGDGGGQEERGGAEKEGAGGGRSAWRGGKA